MGVKLHWEKNHNENFQNDTLLLTRRMTNYPTEEDSWSKIPSSSSHHLLPVYFKAKLLAYLSGFCSVSFCLNFHSYYLGYLGISEGEIEQLFQLPIPFKAIDIETDLFILEQSCFEELIEPRVEKSLLRCAVFMFLKPAQAQECRHTIKQFLGLLMYDALVNFLSYVKYCHQWIESYSDIFPKELPNRTDFVSAAATDHFSLDDVLKKQEFLADFLPIYGKAALTKSKENHDRVAMIDWGTEQVPESNLTDKLRELENWIDLFPDQIYVIELNSQIIFSCNNSFAQRIGFKDSSEVKGKTIFECFKSQSNEADRIIGQHQSVVISGQPLQIRESLTLASGEQVPDSNYYLDTLKIPLKDPDGQVYALISISRDITQIIHEQQILAKHQAELELINQELESFAYSVSHELQTPLKVIDRFSQILWQEYGDYLDNTGKYYVQRIKANCQRMGELIEALLKLSQISRVSLRYQSVNLSVIAAEIAKQLKTTAPEREIQFIIAPDLIVQGDYKLLTIVLENLFHNAWKYTSHHTKALIEFGCCLQEDGNLAYFVRDDGAGFDMNYAHKLFGAFGRLHGEAEFPGHGIGLATVQRIITRHQGHVWAEGIVEQGATFYFSLR